MRAFAFLVNASVAFFFPFTALARSHGIPHIPRHGEIAHHARSNMSKREFTGAQFTYYETGLGACGKFNTDSDMIVALTKIQYGGGEDCFKSITIEINGKQQQATIVDECDGCPYGGLDFSPSLFKLFAPLTEGVLTGSWWFNDAAPTPSTPPPPPPPPPSPSPPPPPSPSPPRPTSQAAAPKPTTSSVHPIPSTSTIPSPSSSIRASSSLSSLAPSVSVSSSNASSIAASGSSASSTNVSSAVTASQTDAPIAVAPSPLPSPQVLGALNQAIVDLGLLVVDAAQM